MLRDTAVGLVSASPAAAPDELQAALQKTAGTKPRLHAANALADELHTWRVRHVALSMETEALLSQCADAEDEVHQLQGQLARFVQHGA